MAKDETKASKVCPDCVDEDENGSEDCCCCCCCSCSDTGSETESTGNLSGGNQLMRTIEQQKKDLLSNLSILRANREPASIQNILQFVEALTHSTDFLRRYNLQEDFCLECLISQPTCTCCTNGISQLNINENSGYSCDECDGTDESRQLRCSSQECTDCTTSAKASITRRQRNVDRRERRRRRRQRNIRHNLPRVSTTHFTRNSSTSSSNQTRDSTTSSMDCSDCPNVGRNSSTPGEVRANSHDSDCEGCDRKDSSKHNDRFKSRFPPGTCHANSNSDSDCCEECSGENLPSSSACPIPGCEDCSSRNRRRPNTSRRDSQEQGLFCTCCNPPESCKRNANSKSSQQKRKKASEKPECDQQRTSASSGNFGNQSAECSCEDCQTNSECSAESCDECNNHQSKKMNKNSKKK